MDQSVLSHPFAGIILAAGVYTFAVWLKSKTANPLANPLLVSAVIVAAVLHYSPFSLAQFRNGASMISMLIIPATTVLALQINRRWPTLKANPVPVLGGCLAGAVASVVSVLVLARLFGLDTAVTMSLAPKSVTTAIAMELSEKTGGIPPLTVTAVIITGITSAVVSPVLLKIFRLKNPIAAGIAIGSSGHAIGTARAIELGDTEAAFSTIALTLTALLTSLLYTFF